MHFHPKQQPYTFHSFLPRLFAFSILLQNAYDIDIEISCSGQFKMYVETENGTRIRNYATNEIQKKMDGSVDFTSAKVSKMRLYTGCTMHMHNVSGYCASENT